MYAMQGEIRSGLCKHQPKELSSNGAKKRTLEMPGMSKQTTKKEGNSNTPVRGTTATIEGGTTLRTDSSTVSHVLKEWQS
ncbi:unnamed protein product [Parnassius apollo]|uniref:(apollo) hypothetical protein n=1 Tax=Parnassius apollo TaxID=110799 RepID=A0A8S3WHM6_PARAO|nr:unnamed protein product [Parnassius apollo]